MIFFHIGYRAASIDSIKMYIILFKIVEIITKSLIKIICKKRKNNTHFTECCPQNHTTFAQTIFFVQCKPWKLFEVSTFYALLVVHMVCSILYSFPFCFLLTKGIARSTSRVYKSIGPIQWVVLEVEKVVCQNYDCVKL